MSETNDTNTNPLNRRDLLRHGAVAGDRGSPGHRRPW